MLDKLPYEIWECLARFLAQGDRVSLTYVGSSVRKAISPIIYQNLFLNEKPSVLSDSDPLLTNFWSVLNIRRAQYEEADQKLTALIRTLRESQLLSSYVEIIQCTWHLNTVLIKELLCVLGMQAVNLRQFRNFLRIELIDQLEILGPQLQSLVLPPPGVLPQEKVDPFYLPRIIKYLSRHSLENITSLNIFMDPGLFFGNVKPHFGKLRLRELELSLRDDNYSLESFNNRRLKYSDIFDTRYLEKLTILSWYENDNVDIYRKFFLDELLAFKNLKELTFMSFFFNDSFLRKCLQAFAQLRRLKLDYMFSQPIPQNTIELLARSPSQKTLQYLDLKFRPLDPYLITTNDGAASHFEINCSCKCSRCQEVIKDIIYQKVFPTPASSNIRSIEDIPKRDIITRIVSVSPIVPYTQFVDSRPGLSFVGDPVEDARQVINELLGRSLLTTGDITKVYHAHLHSLKRTFNYFLQRFPSLRYLTVNDVPTSVEEGPGGQLYNKPIYHSQYYETNQIYEVVDEENLFD
ncbi:LADA_0F02542g1_1 [Lachancea dasiensis]|uniref:LADA_0F02542g1_1 n=1 Tax=Lachancea dasiensis TaxID=1072105 RepID=A0A1G4JIE3_9SACH|nr:LADA_0F02542g1_1 [Lachancea dasiensis]